jgi:hypothetical protein
MKWPHVAAHTRAGIADARATITLQLDGGRAAAATITRKRAVFHNALGYAAELGLLPANLLSQIAWRPPHPGAARMAPGSR